MDGAAERPVNEDVGLVVTNDGPFTMEMQTIPEPGIIGLLGLAGLALLIRRRFINVHNERRWQASTWHSDLACECNLHPPRSG